MWWICVTFETCMFWFLIGMLVLLCSAFLTTMFVKSGEKRIGKFLGLCEKNRILTFLGLGMGGILLALQALIASGHTEAMKEAATAQGEAAKAQGEAATAQATANKYTEQGQRQERFKNAIEHLGHEEESVRLGGAYELFHLAQNTPEMRQTVLDVLCGHIRVKTGEKEYRDEYRLGPSEEIQNLLYLLFVKEHTIFKNHEIRLAKARLDGADLINARLHRADLTGVRLHGADLTEARLIGANLRKAQLYETNLAHAHLYGADLRKAQLYGANLISARLHGAELGGAYLPEANLLGARLYGVNLAHAQLYGANLAHAQLHGANLNKSRFHEANLQGVSLKGVRSSGNTFRTFEKRIEGSIGEMSDLAGVMFSGGLEPKDLDSLPEGFPDEQRRRLRAKLEPHGRPQASQALPANSGVKTGTYTKKDAEGWIAEYKNALNE